MSYVLDGIKTAMEQLGLSDEIQCPCLWIGNAEDREALRFHYTHCTQARVSNTEGESDD